MLTLPQTSNYEKQKGRVDSKPPTDSNSEVLLILGEPTPGDLPAIFRWGANPSRRRRQRHLLIFASDIRGLSQTALQTHHVDIHILSERLSESSGPNSHCANQAPGEAMYLVGVLERASQFATAWRADAERFTLDGQLTQWNPRSPPCHDSAHSSYLSDNTHANHSTPATLNDDNDPKLHNPRDCRYSQSNSVSKPTVTNNASKGLLPNYLNFSSPTMPRLSSSSLHRHQSPTNLGCQSNFLPDTCGRTFDTILNFLPPDLPEKSLLKQVILLSSLCGQYFALPKPKPLLGSGPPIPHASSSIGHFPSPSKPLYSQNLKERAISLSFRTPMTEFKVGEAQRTGIASGSSASESASPARSSTPSETSRSTTVSDSQQRRWSMLSWLSTTSASTSDPKPGANTKVDTYANTSQEKSIELRRRLSSLFGRTAKRSESALNPSRQGVAAGGEESTRKKRRAKMTNVHQASHKHAYLIHVLPTSSLTGSQAGSLSHTLSSQDQILDEHELLEKRRKSLSSPSPLPLAFDRLTETPTDSFTHARMQTSLIRRATLQEIRLPAARVKRPPSRTILNPMSRGDSSRRNVAQVQKLKSEKPPLAGQFETFLDDYFGQGIGDVLPFILDVGVFGREVGVDMGNQKRMSVGEAVLSGLLDEFVMNRQYWVGEEDLRCLVDHLKAGDHEETEGRIEEEIVKGPKHPPLAAISASSSEGSEGTGPAATPTSQRSRARAISDFASPTLTSKWNVTALPGTALNALKTPEPAHVYPASGPAVPQLVRTPTRFAASVLL